MQDDCPVVMDLGSGNSRIGFAGETEPRSIFPTVIGREEGGIERKFVGREAEHRRGSIHLNYPIERGIVTNWDDFENIIHHSYYSNLKTLPEDGITLIIEPLANPRPQREKMSQIFFETYNVEGLSMELSNRASLYSQGKSTGVILDCGEDITTITAFRDFIPLPQSLCRVDFGGRDITNHLMALLYHNHAYSLSGSHEHLHSMFRNLKHKCAKLAIYPDAYDLSTTTYELPDGKSISISSHERELIAEPLFQPGLLYMDDNLAIHKLLFNSIYSEQDISCRNSLYRNIFIVGGTSKTNGFKDRLKKEMNDLAPSSLVLQGGVYIYRDDSSNCAWQGGSILGSLKTFFSAGVIVTKEEYDENGPPVMSRRIPNIITTNRYTPLPTKRSRTDIVGRSSVENLNSSKQEELKTKALILDYRIQWMNIVLNIEKMIRMNFRIVQKQNVWKINHDYTLTKKIATSGSFNLGVYEIESHNDDADGIHALKIVMNLVDIQTRSQLYGSKFNSNMVRNSQSSEYSIPASAPHPLIVPHLNNWIGDINDIAVEYPDVLDLKESLKDTGAAIVSRTSFLVMPLYQRTLSQFFTEATAEIQCYIIFQLVEVLIHLRENYIVHADFRGDNILVIGDTLQSVRIGLADFGFAKSQCHNTKIMERSKLVNFKNEMNQNYLPPELKRIKILPGPQSVLWNYCFGADSWSCGLMILELYAGDFEISLPLKNITNLRELDSYIDNAFNLLSMPEKIKQICRLLLSHDPRDRNLDKVKLLAGELCWDDVAQKTDTSLSPESPVVTYLKQAKQLTEETPFSTDLFKLLKYKFMGNFFQQFYS